MVEAFVPNAPQQPGEEKPVERPRQAEATKKATNTHEVAESVPFFCKIGCRNNYGPLKILVHVLTDGRTEDKGVERASKPKQKSGSSTATDSLHAVK